MPINYLQTVNHDRPSAEPLKLLKETYKKPFSFRALSLSLVIGIVMALVVTGILLGVNKVNDYLNFSKNEEQFAASSEPINEAEQQVAGETIIDLSKLDSDGDGLFDWQEGEWGTDAYKSDTDFDGYSDSHEILYGYDPTGFGRPDMRVKIEKIGVDAPVVFPITTQEVDIQAAMAKGVAHYPGTALPGTNGNIYITGHSSDYAWNEGTYKRVFRQLNDLEIADIVLIESKLNSGKVINYSFQIYDKQVTKVDAPQLWQVDRSGSILSLVTSWPIDSTRERLMVRGVLVE